MIVLFLTQSLRAGALDRTYRIVVLFPVKDSFWDIPGLFFAGKVSFANCLELCEMMW